MSKIQKRFPADTTLDTVTFLNDPKVDAELYAYFQSMSYPDPETGTTRVEKSKLPNQETIAKEVLHRSSRNTVGNHLKYLKEQGYVVDCGTYYELPQCEDIYFKVPLDLLDYFLDTVRESVVKTYIYLGQRYNYKPKEYIFTIKEIAEHTGMNYNRQSKSISNYIDILERLGLITVARFYEGKTPQMRLVSFSTSLPKNN